MRAVIFAGGRGTRLAPYTSVLPKPLIPIGDRAILELIVRQLAAAGFTDLTFCVGYLAHLIQAVFDSQSDLGCKIDYVREEAPLGTAAPLRSVSGLDDSFLAMNGDILTTLDFGAFLRTHREAGNAMTIATHERRTKLDYGVLHLENSQNGHHRVTGFEEKPEVPLIVSMGIYAFEPRALEYIPPEGSFDIPDLIERLIESGEPVGAIPYDGFWLDIGRHEDYEAAVAWETEHSAEIRQGLIT